MAAVTSFVARRPHPLRALGFGLRWALGHSLALLILGGLLLAFDLRLAPGHVRGLETAVGALLVGLGLWALVGVVHLRSGDLTHRLEHRLGRVHSHGRMGGGSLWTGAAHGLAGTAALFALLPLGLIGSPGLATAYVLCFGLGTVLAMGGYALLAGTLLHSLGERAARLAFAGRIGAALASIAIGLLWIGRAV